MLEILKNNRSAIYRINENNTDARFIINGEEPIILYQIDDKTITYTNWFLPISPTVCLGLIDDSLMRKHFKMMPQIYFLEATEDFVKRINNISLVLPGRAIVSQIKINENREILF